MPDSNIVTEVQVKKHLTAEEHAMRRAEMARRRKNLSEKRNEEEKVSRCVPFG
jgi:Ino eighty subunit 2